MKRQWASHQRPWGRKKWHVSQMLRGEKPRTLKPASKDLLSEGEAGLTSEGDREEPVPAHPLRQREFVSRKEVLLKERDEGKGVGKAGRGR